MPAMDIDHVAIRTRDVEGTMAFFNDLIGTETAPRPDFPFPGAWLKLGSTMFHLLGGYMAENKDGVVETGGAAVDHIALAATGFDEMKQAFETASVPWKENYIPGIDLWQLFVPDPNGVTIELNFWAKDEPADSAGPDRNARLTPGRRIGDEIRS